MLGITGKRAGLGLFAAMSASWLSACAVPGIGAPDRGRLLGTGGVSQVEGASGAGLANWATITGYGSRDGYGATGYVSHVALDDFSMQSGGAAVGIRNRVELSYARQSFDMGEHAAALGLRPGFRFDQDIVGAKVRVAGDMMFDQDTLMPQIAVGAQYKASRDADTVRAMGADSADGVDVYATATKVFLDKSLLLSASLRGTRANQLGLLGFGSAGGGGGYGAQFEGSAVYMLRRDLVVGADYRTKPDNLNNGEGDAAAAYVAWFPNKSLSLSAAAVDMGEIGGQGRQRGVMGSVQVGF